MTLSQDLTNAAAAALDLEVSKQAALNQLASAQGQLITDTQLITNLKNQVAELQAELDALRPPAAAPWLGVWPHGPDLTTWQQVKTFAPKVKAYRWRGDSDGRWDFCFSKLDQLVTLKQAGGIVSANLNPRQGQSPNKTAYKLTDVAAGRYDADLLAAAKALAPLDGICEIWSECNIMHGATAAQPTPSDYSLPNWEAAFLHVAKLLRANGVKLKIGTSIAGPTDMANWQRFVTPGITSASDFVGFDIYQRNNDTSHFFSKTLPVALKAAAEMKLPLAVCEFGVDKTLGISDAYFTDALTTIKGIPADKLLGVVANDGDQSNGAYVFDAGSPNHAPFVTFASDGVWQQ